MRRFPPPDRVTLPPPSSTTRDFVFTTFAVAAMAMVTGAGPQSNVMIPPAATAFTTAAEVQLAGVPVPTTRSGWRVSTGRPSAGTVAPPCGFPGEGSGFAVVGAAVTCAVAGPLFGVRGADGAGECEAGPAATGA